MIKKVITLTPAAYELLVSQIESMPYGLAKPLLQLLRSNAEPMSVEVPASESTNKDGGAE